MKLAVRWNEYNAPELFDPNTGDKVEGVSSISIDAKRDEPASATVTLSLAPPFPAADCMKAAAIAHTLAMGGSISTGEVQTGADLGNEGDSPL